MNKSLLTQLYWVIPGFILIFGLVLLFYQSFSKVTEAPEPDWSRALFVGETDVNKRLPVKETAEGEFIFTRYEGKKLATTTLSKDYIVKDTKTYDIPVDKWTQIYQQDETIIYFDFTNIYDKNKQIIVADVERFYPLETTIFYLKENGLYQLTPDSKQVKRVIDIDLNKQDISLYENKDGIHLLVHTPELNGVDIRLHHFDNGKMHMLYQSNIKVDPGKIVNDISFALEDQTLALFLQEELEQTQGKPEFFYYFMQTSVEIQDPQTLHALTFRDPAGTNDLTEVSDVVLQYNNGQPHVLFRANGQTETQYKDRTAFNIYLAEITADGLTKTERRSNTPAISTNPQWINDETIAWLDLGADGNKLNISTGNLAAVSQVITTNQEDWLRALSKTLGMITSSFFLVALSFVWFIWPIIFITVMYVFRHRTIDRDPPWYFYTGIGLYALAAIIWRKEFFVNNIYVNAPDYLTFSGSSYLYMIVFAILAFALTLLTKRINEWGGTARIMYFVGMHILLLTIFFGPFLI